MSYVLEEQLAAKENYGRKRCAEEIQYLVVHYTGNDGDRASSNAAYFQNHVVKSSAHYFVDDDTVYRSVPELHIAWAVGGKKYASAKMTGGGKLYGVVTNANSINVELCDTQRDGSYQATEATLENAAKLCRSLMKKYDIPVENVYRHFDVTGKLCPCYFVNEAAWSAFKNRLVGADDSGHVVKEKGERTVTQEQFDAFMENWLTQRGELEPSGGSTEARHWAEEQGVISGFSDGSKRYKDFCTREQVVLMLYRLWRSMETEK